ncbi:hypothetical protein BDW59DRAFT_21091 [Aspergillus cavernicola]|uniref:Secreted protein n=1 Tax=Aspergillus cavernicola TaxID=176166 RepID=A0ABR4HGE6_9EURO
MHRNLGSFPNSYLCIFLLIAILNSLRIVSGTRCFLSATPLSRIDSSSLLYTRQLVTNRIASCTRPWLISAIKNYCISSRTFNELFLSKPLVVSDSFVCSSSIRCFALRDAPCGQRLRGPHS